MRHARTTAPAAGRERLIEAARALFSERGFHGVSIRDVAGAVGVTPAAIYYHFPDKEQLYLAVIAAVYHDRIPALIDEAVAEGDPWQRMERLVAGMVAMNIADPQLLRLSQWILLDTDPARQQKLGENVVRPFVAAVARLAADLGGGHDPQQLALSVMGLVMFPFHAAGVTAHLPGYRPPTADPDSLARHVMQLLRDGLSRGEGA